ncbi:restriction endonuclease subunit S [Bacillus altitudinis]|uniref:restriction endonuclease subunit S n=1 Tax=Bacillus altitudinis TaxID=293387 RepID=UPI00320A885A
MSYWFNELPSDWNVVKVKNVFNMISGGTPKSDIEEYWSDSEVIWVTPEDLSKEGKYLNDSIRKISNLGLQNCSANVIKANSIVVSTRAPIGNVKVSTVPFTTNQGCKSLEAKGKVNITYYYYVIALAKEHLNNLGQGTTFLELSNYSLKNVFVPYPDINLQDLIAYYLDTKCNQIDELIVAKKKQISLLEQQRQSIITEAVTKGLNPNVKMKDSGVEWIGEIPEHWGTKKIKYLIQEKLLYGANESAELDDEKLPRYIRITDIDELGNLKNETFKSIPLDIANKYVVKKGDILLARSGATVGKSYIHKEEKEASYAGYLIKLRARTLELAEYIYYFTNSSLYKQWINSILIQATIQNVSAEKYANLSIPVPKDENEIKSILLNIKFKEKEILEVINKLKEQIEKLKEYRQSLIYEAVTGKIDVRDMELDEVR